LIWADRRLIIGGHHCEIRDACLQIFNVSSVHWIAHDWNFDSLALM